MSSYQFALLFLEDVATVRTICHVELLALYTCLAFSVPLGSFYPYGTSNDDTLFSRNDDDSTYINLLIPFIFYNKPYSRVYVS